MACVRSSNPEALMTGVGQSLPARFASGRPDVRYAPNSDQNIAAPRLVAVCHVWTAPAVQEESDVLAKRSGAAMYPACFRLEDCLHRDAAALAAGPDVIR
jgi:hypothetical protein